MEMIKRINLHSKVWWHEAWASSVGEDDIAKEKKDIVKSIITLFSVIDLLKKNDKDEMGNENRNTLDDVLKSPLIKMYYSYIYRLIEVLPKEAQDEFEFFVRKFDFSESSLQSYYDFTKEYVINELHMVRNHEFGQYCLNWITEELMENFEEKDLEKFKRRINIRSINTFEEKVFKRVGVKNIEELERTELNLLIKVFIQKFNRSSLTQMDVYDLALDLKESGLSYKNKIEKIKPVIRHTINRGLNRGRKIGW